MKDIKEFLLEVDSSNPAPGGGAVASYTAALGVALARMAMNIVMKRKSYQNYEEAIRNNNQQIMDRLFELEMKMYDLKDKDEEVYNDFMISYRQKDELEIKRKTINCFMSPCELFDTIKEALNLIFMLEKYIAKSVLSDYNMSLLMLKSMLSCSIENMYINIVNIDNQEILNLYVMKLKENKELIEKIDKIVER